MITLDDAWVKVKQIASEWRVYRDSNDVVGLQSTRDVLSEFLLDVGYLETQIYHDYIIQEQEKKECLEDKLKELSDDKTIKMSVEMMKNEANIACRDLLRKERIAESHYKSVRTLTQRSDQILHSVSSAIKTILKID